MNAGQMHPWKVTPEVARKIQQQLQHQVVKTDMLGTVCFVAGMDVGYENNQTVTRAAAVVLSFPELKLLEHATVRRSTDFPYIPGLLSFREAPAALDALESLHRKPDLLLCDGQGLAHPRRFGLACHIGILSQIPTIGVAKSRLVGKHRTLAEERGAWQPLIEDDEIIGAALRTRSAVKPVYVSIGHKISLETAIELVLQCAPRYRLPETTRWAHRLASAESSEFAP
jgi:deoxyribonuclease V